MQDVLKAIMGVDNQPFGILRISSPTSRLSGRLAIADGAYIVGAVSADDLTPEELDSGYLAVRKLLSASEGNFAFLDTDGKRPTDMDGSLYLSIDRLMPLLPQLPEDPGELFDEKSLLDKVFGPDGNLLSTANAPNIDTTARMVVDGYPYTAGGNAASRLRVPPAENESAASGWARAVAETSTGRDMPRATPPDPSGRDSGKNAVNHAPNGKEPGAISHNPSWQVFQPLISNSAITDPNAKRPADSYAFPGLDEPSATRQSLTRLRDNDQPTEESWYKQLFRESVFSKTSLIWIGAILILSLVATLFATAAVNQHNSLTIHRNGTARP
jgi:hypothetical protein